MNKIKTIIAIAFVTIFAITATISTNASEYNYHYYTRRYVDHNIPYYQTNTFYVEKGWGCEWFEWDKEEECFCSLDWNKKVEFGSNIKYGTYKVISSTKKEVCKGGNTYQYSTKIKHGDRIYTISATGKDSKGKAVKIKNNRIFVSLNMAKLIYKFSKQKNGLQILLRNTPINKKKIDEFYMYGDGRWE